MYQLDAEQEEVAIHYAKALGAQQLENPDTVSQRSVPFVSSIALWSSFHFSFHCKYSFLGDNKYDIVLFERMLFAL